MSHYSFFVCFKVNKTDYIDDKDLPPNFFKSCRFVEIKEFWRYALILLLFYVYRRNMTDIFLKTDEAIQKITFWPSIPRSKITQNSAKIAYSKKKFMFELRNIR